VPNLDVEKPRDRVRGVTSNARDRFEALAELGDPAARRA